MPFFVSSGVASVCAAGAATVLATPAAVFAAAVASAGLVSCHRLCGMARGQPLDKNSTLLKHPGCMPHKKLWNEMIYIYNGIVMKKKSIYWSSARGFHSILRIWVSQQVAFSLHILFQSQASLGPCSVVAAAGCAEAPQPIAERSRWGDDECGPRMGRANAWTSKLQRFQQRLIYIYIILNIYVYIIRLTGRGCPSAPHPMLLKEGKL